MVQTDYTGERRLISYTAIIDGKAETVDVLFIAEMQTGLDSALPTSPADSLVFFAQPGRPKPGFPRFEIIPTALVEKFTRRPEDFTGLIDVNGNPA